MKKGFWKKLAEGFTTAPYLSNLIPPPPPVKKSEKFFQKDLAMWAEDTLNLRIGEELTISFRVKAIGAGFVVVDVVQVGTGVLQLR